MGQHKHLCGNTGLRNLVGVGILGLAACATPRDTGWPLEGTYWRLSSLQGKVVTGPAGGREANLVLEPASRRAAGYSGCNRFTGSYELRGSALRIGQVAGTRMACLDGMEQEQAFLKVLGSASSWRVDAGRLQLMDEGGNALAEFTSGSERFSCDGGKPVLVHYDNTNPQQPQAMLVFEGKSYQMRSAPTASGARYVVEKGRSPDMSLEWVSKGAEGLLMEAPLSDARKPEDLKTLARCTRQ
ncbi:MAG TPA: META domain-containing protein [Rhizobacter sp.]|nr:META domain-containing protein [Rhizobacter sp.]